MKFKNLEMTGFKSFSEKTNILIEKGLTGIVGPNGCGKSNIVEALRWCMGENSAKSMRGSGMEDVIFSGTSNRPSKNISEVALLLDNREKSGPIQFKEFDLPGVNKFSDTQVCIPNGWWLKSDELDYIVEKINEF